MTNKLKSLKNSRISFTSVYICSLSIFTVKKLRHNSYSQFFVFCLFLSVVSYRFVYTFRAPISMSCTIYWPENYTHISHSHFHSIFVFRMKFLFFHSLFLSKQNIIKYTNEWEWDLLKLFASAQAIDVVRLLKCTTAYTRLMCILYVLDVHKNRRPTIKKRKKVISFTVIVVYRISCPAPKSNTIIIDSQQQQQ